MRSMRFAGAALAVLFALPDHAAAGAPSAACLGPPPVMVAHPDARHVVVLATGTAETVPAGWGDVYLGYQQRRPRGWQRITVHGQVARAARVAGPGADGLSAGPVVLVPWYPGCGGTYRWFRSFAWLRPGAPDVVVGRLRPREDWAGGIPTVDVLRTDLVDEAGEHPRARRWNPAPDVLFGFAATLPTQRAIETDPWVAVEPMRAWLAANREAARHRAVRLVSNGIYRTAAHAAVRAAPSPLAGTYRVEVSRTGGPAHVVYARTELVPDGALFHADTTPAVFPASVPGYALKTSFRRGVAQLPAPGPAPRPGWLARLWPWGRRSPPPADQMEVWLPGDSPLPGGAHRFRGHLGLWNVSDFLFPGDAELGDWIDEWSRRETRSGRAQNPVGEVVLRPDGGVEWTEVMELAPGRAVTIRATRISPVALEASPDR